MREKLQHSGHKREWWCALTLNELVHTVAHARVEVGLGGLDVHVEVGAEPHHTQAALQVMAKVDT